jgi:AcrR family transcriptional regulator
MTVEARELRGGQATGGRILTARGLRTRALLVAAAREVFDEITFAEAKIADITTRAGVASGTFYTYFDSKEELFREVAAEVLAEFSAAPTRDPEADPGDLVHNLAFATREFFRTCLRHAGVARSIEQLAPHDRDVADARLSTVITGVKRAERWIRRLQEEGVCDGAIDAWTTAMALHTMTVRVAYDHLLLHGSEDDVEPLVDAVTHIWARTVGLEGVSSEPGAARPG